MILPQLKPGRSVVRIAALLAAFNSFVFAAGEPAADGFPFSYLVFSILLLAAGAGAIYYLRYIRPTAQVGSDRPKAPVNTEMRQTNKAAREANREKRVEPPSKREVAESAAVPNANFSRLYSESVDISDLPVYGFKGVEPPPPVEELEESSDPDLLDAIDQLADDAETDPEIRLLALKIVARFRARNAVEILGEIAQFDLSSMLRSKAVSILADFDHPSVFPPIVIACADTTKEVRSAAARALVRLSFDRAESWARIALSNDEYLCRQVARAAVEAGLAEKSFDRLAMRDPKAAYEAFALAFLLLRAGEIRPIFKAIREHRDMKTRLALIHTIKVANVAEVIPELCEFIAAEPMSSQLADRARDALLNINNAPASRN